MGKKSILIVEDDQLIKNAMQLSLEALSYKVVLASDGKEALGFLSSIEKPGLILLDLMMPVMDGWEFVDRLKEIPDLISIPIVVITAFANKANTPKEASQVVTKPIDIKTLKALAAQYCGA